MRTLIFTITIIALFFAGCTSQKQNNSPQLITIDVNNTLPLHIVFEAGKAFNNPTFAIWIEDLNENLITTLFVTKSLATGTYGHAYVKDNMWLPDSGASIRPATLPYWLHKQTGGNIKSANPKSPLVPDAISGATPKGDFTIQTSIQNQLPQKFRVYMEINQAWDWNEFYTNAKYPNNFEYKTSAQPSLVYAVTIDSKNNNHTYYLNPIGHGHYAGENGQLYTDLRGHTSALQIVKSVSITLKK